MTVVFLSLVYGAITFQQSGAVGVCLDIGHQHAGAMTGLFNVNAREGIGTVDARATSAARSGSLSPASVGDDGTARFRTTTVTTLDGADTLASAQFTLARLDRLRWPRVEFGSVSEN